VKSACWHVLME